MADHRGREEAEEEGGARFDLAAGTGDPLADLPAVAAVGPRGAPARRLEAQLEPLHRLVFGRAGRTGERRRALDAFRGFPPDMRDDVAERVGRLSKDKLRALIDALGVPAHISNPRAKVAEDVVAFLMHPSVEGAKRGHSKSARPAGKATKRGRTASPKNSAVNASAKEEETVGATTPETGKAATKSPSPKTKATKTTTKTTTTTADEGVKAKRTKKELPVAERSPSANPPSDDALRVAVYKRILLTPREERSNLTTKALRLELQESFGELEARKAVIKEAASECITALVAAEEAAAAAATATSTATATGTGTTTATVAATSITRTLTEGGTISVSLPGASSEPARTSGNGRDHTVEPSPAPQPPSMQLTDAAAATRSQPPPPETPDSSVPQHSSVPSFPAHPPVAATVVSVPSCPPPGAPIV